MCCRALGRTWLLALASPPPVAGPIRPSPPSTAGYLSLHCPRHRGALWLTSYNEDFGGITFASTGDAGLQWSQTAYPGQRPGAKSLLPPSGWTSTAASGPAVAWAVFTGQRNEAGVEDSALYATHDTGAHWRLAKVFSWPPAEG